MREEGAAWGLVPLLAVTLAGCLGAPSEVPLEGNAALPPPEAPSSVAQLLPLEFAMADGVVLRGHAYLPEGPGPFATVLVMSPYWNNLKGPSDGLLVEVDGHRTIRPFGVFTDAGFAFAAVHMRGTGLSGGCFRAWNPDIGADVAAVVGGLAAEPWSDGAVGMVGLSYDGWLQFMALEHRPPALRAILPVSGVTDAWALLTRAGASVAPLDAPYWTAGVALGTFGLVTPYGEPHPNPTVPPLEPEHACPEQAEDFAANAATIWDGDRTAWFRERDFRPRVAGADIPVLATNGFADAETTPTQLEGVWDLLGGEKRFLLGQWGHQFPTRDGFAAMAVAWFDQHLRGGPATLPGGVVEYQDDNGDWYEAPRWPPPATEARLLLADGRLVAEASEVRPWQAAFATTDRLAPYPEECPAAHALLVSPPLAEDVRLAGSFTASFTLTSTAPNGNVAAYLWRVDRVLPCGDASPLLGAVEGIRRVEYALSDLRHRGHLEEGRAFPVGAPDTLELASLPFATHVRAGERLVLAIGGGDPHLVAKPEQPLLTLTTGPGIVGELRLPVVEGALRFVAPS